MGLLDETRTALSQAQQYPFGWMWALVVALGPEGRRLSIVWVRRCLFRLLPFTEDEWQRNMLRPELERLEAYETQAPTREELEERLEVLHQIFHQGAQPAVNNLFVAYMQSRYAENDSFVGNLSYALLFMLNETGNRPEHQEAIIEEYQRVAAEAGVLIESSVEEGGREEKIAADHGNGPR